MAQTFYIPVLRTLSEADTAWYLSRLYEHRQRVGKNSGTLSGHKTGKAGAQKIRLLKELPGAGNKTAKALLQHFKSIKNIVNASEKELLEVPGIGAKTAKKIMETFDNET